MSFEDLPDYLNKMKSQEKFIEVEEEVDPDLELTYILSRELESGHRRTMLFKNVKGYNIPVVGNIFAELERIKLILGNEPEDVGNRLLNLVSIPSDTNSLIGRGLRMFREISGVMPKISGPLASSHVIEDRPDLKTIPVCRTWPNDAGPFMTLPLVITKDFKSGVRNVGMYRMQVYDSETTGMHWQVHKGGSSHQASSQGKVMDVAVVLGTDPLNILSAVAPLPDGIDEFSFAGLVSRKRVELAKGLTVDLEYPKNSEIVLEGYVDPSETRIEGPFGDHTGYYSLEEEFPVFHLKRIIRKRQPIYPTTIVGELWHEDVAIGKAIERMFLPFIRFQIPEIVDINTLEESAFHNMVVVSIRKRFPGQAKKVMFALWGMGQLMLSKIILVVDSDIDVHNRSQVLWAMTTRIDPQRDVLVVPGTVTDSLDHASRLMNYGSKMGIDATRKDKTEGFNRRWPDKLEIPKELMESVKKRWSELGL